MPSSEIIEFLVFRYQLLPTRAEFQSTLFPHVRSVEDLISRKNEIFATVLKQTKDFSIRGVKLIHKELAGSDDVFVYRIATSRNLTRETKDFRREKVENWPSILVVFDNKPDIQKLLVERNTKVFQLPRTVSNLLSDRLNSGLRQYQLELHIEPIFVRAEFWKLVQEHRDRIIEAHFELVSPNMANISHALADDLKDFAKSTNTAKTELTLQSPKAGRLKLEQTDKNLDSLVHYASQGGGNVAVRVKGLRHTIQTDRTIEKVCVEELNIEAATPEQTIELFRKITRC
jgi:hypothetical protein